jgi:hypothetical protein
MREPARRAARPAPSLAAGPARRPAGAAPSPHARLLVVGQAVGNRSLARALHAAGGDFLQRWKQSANAEGACGYFVRRRVFTGPTASKKGVIVQKITRAFDVKKVSDGSSLSGSGLDAYVTDPASSVHAGVAEYWEAFDVGKREGTVTDVWGIPSLMPQGSNGKDTTKGSFVMTGSAAYYDGVTAADLGFTSVGCPVSGVVPSLTSAPNVSGQTKLGNDLDYKVTVTWDSSSDDTLYSKVVDA